MSRPKLLVAFISIVGTAAYFVSVENTTRESKSESQTLESRIDGAGGEMNGASSAITHTDRARQPESAKGTTTADPVIELRAALATGTNDAWLRSYPALMSLPAWSLWELLQRPEIWSQGRAKQLMRSLLGACSGPLSEFDARDVLSADGGDPILSSQPLNRAWCRELQSLSMEQRATVGKALSRDADLRALRMRLPPMELYDDEGERSQLLDRSKQVLRESADPYLLNSAIHNMLYAKDPSILGTDADWQNLPHSQQSRVEIALQAMISCEAARACGPSSLLTLEYCGWVNGLDCQVGMGLQQVLQSSLSPVQMRVLNSALMRARALRLPPAGS